MARAQQLLLAIVFLTRLPLARFLPARVMPVGGCVWAFGLVGALVGACAALPLLLSGPALLLAMLSVTVSVLLTGALHEDGLADLADASGGATPERRLEIMRDSRIGSYGAMALVLTTGLRVAALTVVAPLQLIAAAAAGRAAIVVTLAALPPARPDGLGRGAGRPGWRAVLCAGVPGLILIGAAPGGRAVALAAGLLVLALVIRHGRRRLGGQTGDLLGAASVLVETAMLAGFALVF